MKKLNAISIFVGGLVIGVICSSGIVYAAVGDAIFRYSTETQCISGPQANCYAQCAIADGTWNQAANQLHKVVARRVARCASGFASQAHGYKTAPLADVPSGSIVDGVVE